MKLLILTCSTGGGHNSAAKAIAQAAAADGAECRIVDALQFLPGYDGKLISHGHNFVYRYLPFFSASDINMNSAAGPRPSA